MKVHFESIDEFVEWSWKEKQHKEELQQHNTELEIENRRLKKELIKRMEIISEMIGPVEFPIDDLPDDYS